MVEQPKKTKERVYEDLDREWNFEDLIEPYREGGTPSNPVRRTWGTMVDWLKNKHRFPEWAIGAGIFLVWMKIKTDGHFAGDGTYGSAGDQFAQAVRAMCASVMKKQMTQKIFSGMAGEVESRIKTAFQADYWYNMPWFMKMLCPKYWQYRKLNKVNKRFTEKRMAEAQKAKNG